MTLPSTHAWQHKCEDTSTQTCDYQYKHMTINTNITINPKIQMWQHKPTISHQKIFEREVRFHKFLILFLCISDHDNVFYTSMIMTMYISVYRPVTTYIHRKLTHAIHISSISKTSRPQTVLHSLWQLTINMPPTGHCNDITVITCHQHVTIMTSSQYHATNMSL